jgi:hypothetical protein
LPYATPIENLIMNILNIAKKAKGGKEENEKV